jgi:hypothetical protein
MQVVCFSAKGFKKEHTEISKEDLEFGERKF